MFKSRILSALLGSLLAVCANAFPTIGKVIDHASTTENVKAYLIRKKRKGSAVYYLKLVNKSAYMWSVKCTVLKERKSASGRVELYEDSVRFRMRHHSMVNTGIVENNEKWLEIVKLENANKPEEMP